MGRVAKSMPRCSITTPGKQRPRALLAVACEACLVTMFEGSNCADHQERSVPPKQNREALASGLDLDAIPDSTSERLSDLEQVSSPLCASTAVPAQK